MNCDLRPSGSWARAGLCAEKQRLLDELLTAIRELLHTQEEQLKAVVGKDPDFARFDILLEMANAKKRAAKYAYINHVETHEC
jgi:hypothetical protein